MNSKFNDNQIVAYAAAFEAGDAIWCDGEWRKVSKLAGIPRGLTCVPPNRYVIHCPDGEVAISGFREEKSPYRVTTLTDYKLQGGEKIVWLADRGVMKGEVFETFVDAHGNVVYENEFGRVDKPVHQEWGVIPHYEQVQSIEQKEVEASDIANILYKRYYDYLHNILRVDIESALNKNDYQKVVELSGLMIEMEGSK